MCARKTRLASSQSQGSQALASAAALPGEAASPAGPQHVEPEPALLRRVISTSFSAVEDEPGLEAGRLVATHRA